MTPNRVFLLDGSACFIACPDDITEPIKKGHYALIPKILYGKLKTLNSYELNLCNLYYQIMIFNNTDMSTYLIISSE